MKPGGKLAQLLGREVIEIPGAPGYLIAFTAHAAEYVRELARTATLRSGHPWVQAADTDAAMLAAIKVRWAAAKPGWLRDSTDAEIIALHAHSAIFHHLPQGAILLAPEQTQALVALAEKPDLARKKISAYRGADSFPGEHSVLDLVLAEYSRVVFAKLVLDTDAYDDDDIVRYDTVASRGKLVTEALALGEVQS